MQAASDVYSPISGEVVEVNESLSEDPQKVPFTYSPAAATLFV